MGYEVEGLFCFFFVSLILVGDFVSFCSVVFRCEQYLILVFLESCFTLTYLWQSSAICWSFIFSSFFYFFFFFFWFRLISVSLVETGLCTNIKRVNLSASLKSLQCLFTQKWYNLSLPSIAYEKEMSLDWTVPWVIPLLRRMSIHKPF